MSQQQYQLQRAINIEGPYWALPHVLVGVTSAYNIQPWSQAFPLPGCAVCKLQEITNWRWGRPGNKATDINEPLSLWSNNMTQLYPWKAWFSFVSNLQQLGTCEAQWHLEPHILATAFFSQNSFLNGVCDPCQKNRQVFSHNAVVPGQHTGQYT